MRLGLLGLVILLGTAGCGGSSPARPVRSAMSPANSPTSLIVSHTSPAEPAASPAEPAASPSSMLRTGWTVTVYYTAVEGFHTGPTVGVHGCPRLDCAYGHDDLGTYPASFVEAVRAEGTGRTAAGAYLNWSHDTGYWLDQAPRDAHGQPLQPFRSAAADPGVLPRGTGFAIVTCGHDEDGGPVDGRVCDRLRGARWSVTDEFTPGLGGARHVDVYIGEETGAHFTDGPWYTTLAAATLRTAA